MVAADGPGVAGPLANLGLLAWAWRRLSFALAPRRWLAPLTAVFFVAMIQHGNLAGEWVIGGMEAKGFAFVLVFLGLEAFVRDRWQRAWLLLGAAAAFHVLVGGWAAVAVGIAWLLLGIATAAPLHVGVARRRIAVLAPRVASPVAAQLGGQGVGDPCGQ